MTRNSIDQIEQNLEPGEKILRPKKFYVDEFKSALVAVTPWTIRSLTNALARHPKIRNGILNRRNANRCGVDCCSCQRPSNWSRDVATAVSDFGVCGSMAEAGVTGQTLDLRISGLGGLEDLNGTPISCVLACKQA